MMTKSKDYIINISKRIKVNKAVIKFVAMLLIVGTIIYLFTLFFYQLYFVTGKSMEPTYNDKQPVIIKKYNYKETLKANDVIVLHPDNLDCTIIKRVIAVPGDRIQIKDGIIYVNNSVFKDINIFQVINDSGIAVNPILLGENEYFVLGDNRNNSIDSRFTDIGIVNSSSFIGKVILP